MIITLIGYMGSGKSFVGRQLSDRLSFPFYDLDTLIEEKEKKTISTLFKEKGEIYFRKIERMVLMETLKQKDDCILSLGGGTPCFYDTMDLINENSTSFYLQNSIQTLSKRLQKEKGKRPLIAHLEDDQLPEFIAKHLFERRPFYERAIYTINIDQQDVEEIVDFIQEKIYLDRI